MIEIIQTQDSKLLAEMNEEIQTLHHEIYPNIFKPYNKDAVLNFFAETFKEKNAVAFIAMENEKPLGYLLLFIINFKENPFQYSRNYILLDQIVVLKSHQLKGIAKQLMETTFSFARANKMESIELNHWTKNNAAKAFFNKLGFEYYNEKMWKVLE